MKIVSLKEITVTTTFHNKVGKKKKLISKGEIDHLVQFAQVTIKAGDVVTEHKHFDLYEIFFVESGNGVIRVNGKEYTIEKGMCISIEPNEYHEVINTGRKVLKLTYFAILV